MRNARTKPRAVQSGVNKVNNNKELWKPVGGYIGYEVSNFGRVRSMKHRKVKINTTVPNYAGYPVITLHDRGKRRQFRLSRLVLEAFVGKCPDNYQANHLDGDKDNNRLENLEWTTPSGNSKHAYFLGLSKGPVGEINGRGRLKLVEVTKIKELARGGVVISTIAQEFNISASHVYAIKNGTKWKSVTV